MRSVPTLYISDLSSFSVSVRVMQVNPAKNYSEAAIVESTEVGDHRAA